jgi:NADPH2:quinone reductase
MLAVVCEALGVPLAVRAIDDPPAPGEGQVRIRVHAAGVNFPDLLMVAGQYQEKPSLPFVPGLEVAGAVIDAGPGTGFATGDRVMATVDDGGFAEQVLADAARVIALPAAMPFDVAAGFAVVYLSAWLGLVHRCRLAAGETLLVLGAAGGIGLAAVEIGKAVGATVIAAAGNADKLAVCRDHGADATVDYTAEDLRARVRAITGGAGADVVFDPVGGDLAGQALRCIGWEGRYAVIGFAAGAIPRFPANYLLVKNCAVVGVRGSAYVKGEPETVRRATAALFDWYAAGRLAPRVHARLSLDRIDDAFALLSERRVEGKVVLTTGAEGA